jgi:hypothetical protein
MPVGNDATMELVPTPEQREYMFHRIREIRGYEGGKKIFTHGLPERRRVGQAAASPEARTTATSIRDGDVEPCVFIHYSSANIHDQSLLDCLQQPLFRAYQAAQPFNENLLRPCPFLENPEKLQAHGQGNRSAKSTDMLDPGVRRASVRQVRELRQGVEAPVADKLWAEEMKKKAEAKKQAAAK